MVYTPTSYILHQKLSMLEEIRSGISVYDEHQPLSMWYVSASQYVVCFSLLSTNYGWAQVPQPGRTE